jgi:hypothetical protein
MGMITDIPHINRLVEHTMETFQGRSSPSLQGSDEPGIERITRDRSRNIFRKAREISVPSGGTLSRAAGRSRVRSKSSEASFAGGHGHGCGWTLRIGRSSASCTR